MKMNASMYMDIAKDMMTYGRTFQKKTIRYIMENKTGAELNRDIKHFVDIQIALERYRA